MKKSKRNQKSINISKRKKLFFILFSLLVTLFLAFTFLELIFRTIPIPGVQLNCAKYDLWVGSGYYPHAIMIYRNARGDFVRRKVNSQGYFDIEHKKEKSKEIYRIGFFGDSFTEAIQVPLEDTFFRIIERELKNYNVECLAFGVSGFSTLQSYLNSKRWSDYFDLDLVVYVFSENDLGDQIKEIKKSPNIPYPILTANDFQVDYSFRKKNRYRQKMFFKICDYFTAHSYVISTFVERIRLLMRYGIRTKVSEEDRMMSTKSDGKSQSNKIPNQNDLPSTWPDFWREHALNLGSAVILKWNDYVKEQFRRFAILYVPRGSEMEKETKDQDSWKFWLESLCKKRDIIFIDSTDELLKMKFSGKDVFYDHLTKEGHMAFASAFVKFYKKNFIKNKKIDG